ncbi:MAG TPA: AlkA N-terminal domain-containing protein [Ruania sp.]|nr:AlkA N-terminal domain-containing protein [Ruania sp.]
MRLIQDGEVDRTGIDGLAGLLGLTPRQVLRAVESVAGCGPLKVARAARAHLARLLLKETAVPMAQVARATGCTSVRQFNTTIRRFYGTTPSVLRFGARRPAASATSTGPDLVFWCALPHRRPFDADAFFTSPVTPVIPDLAAQGEHWYSRTVRLPHGAGHVRLSSDSRGRVLARLSVQDARDVMPLYARTRIFLDLDADTGIIEEQLGGADPGLAVHLSAHRGMRVPGSIDLQESLFTALAEELFTHPAAVLEDLVARLGEATSWGLVFPTAAAITAHGSDVLQHHQARPQMSQVSAGATRTVLALAHDLEADRLQLHYGTSRSYLTTRLAGVPGIDQGTAQRLTRRTLGDADDLREEDPAVIRGAVACGLPSDPDALAAHGQRWAPWRSYAAMHLRAASTGHP